PKLKGRPRKKTTAIIRTNNGNSGTANGTGNTNTPSSTTTTTSNNGTPVGNGGAGCQRSSSPESNTSDESKTSQIRTTRRSALNKSNSTEKASERQLTAVQRRNSYVKNGSNSSNNSNDNNANNNHTNNGCNNNNTAANDSNSDNTGNTNSLGTTVDLEDWTDDASATATGAKLKEMCVKNEQTFLKHLNKFMRERKTPIQRVPHLGFKQIDLFFFWSHGQKLGGYEKITGNKLWKKLYDAMGGDPGSTSAATCTRRHYEKLLLPFERHLNGECEKKTRRKTTSTSSTGSKKAKSKGSAVNGVKSKKKSSSTKTVNGVPKGKGSSKCSVHEDNGDDDDGYSDSVSTPDKGSSREGGGRESPKEVSDDDNDSTGSKKQPKLIVKLNLSKVKSSSSPEDSDEEEDDDNDASDGQDVGSDADIKDMDFKRDIEEDSTSMSIKRDVQRIVDDMNSDTEDSDKPLPKTSSLFDLKREDLTEEDDNTFDPLSAATKKSVSALAVDTKTGADPKASDSVIHLSPVSDIDEDDDPISDIKAESMAKSSSLPAKPIVDAKCGQKVDKPLLMTASPILAGSASAIPSVAMANIATNTAFPVAASPLFSISTLVNSVKTEPQLTSPPPTAPPAPSMPTAAAPYGTATYTPSLTPPKHHFASSPITPLQMKKGYDKAYDKSYDMSSNRRQTVIKTTNTNPLIATQYTPQTHYKTKGFESLPIPAHSYQSALYRVECETAMAGKKAPADMAQVYNDVLDLSVKKRCLEADSRTSPSQALIDGSANGLDLSVKKRKLELMDAPKHDVPKAKHLLTVSGGDHRISHSLTPPLMSSLPMAMSMAAALQHRSLTPLPPAPSQPKTPPHKLCPQPVNSVPQSVQKSSQQSLHYHHNHHHHNSGAGSAKPYAPAADPQKYVNNHNKPNKTPQQQSYTTSTHVHLSPHHHNAYQSSVSQSQHHSNSGQHHHQSYQKSVPQQVSPHQLKANSRDMMAADIKHHDRHHHNLSAHSPAAILKPQVRHSSGQPSVSQSTPSPVHQSMYNCVVSPSSHRTSSSSTKSSPVSSKPSSMHRQSSPSVRSAHSAAELELSAKLLSPSSMMMMSALPSIPTSLVPTMAHTKSSHQNTITTTAAPAISEYNPSLPAFNPLLYSSPNLWYGSGLHPSVSAAGGSPYMSPPNAMSQLSPHMLAASHPLLSGGYPGAGIPAEHLLAAAAAAQFGGAKGAELAAYKQLLDQHQQQSAPNPYQLQLFQHFYATK
ncbi:unnamed protein product, partial [Oppiella nova]